MDYNHRNTFSEQNAEILNTRPRRKETNQRSSKDLIDIQRISKNNTPTNKMLPWTHLFLTFNLSIDKHTKHISFNIN
jgi:hypothetical protein